VVACASLLGDWHLSDSLNAAGSADACPVFFPFPLSKLFGRRVLGAEGASQEPCAGGSEDPLVADETSLLAGRKTLAPPPLPEFGLLFLNFPSPKRMSHPAFRIL
jgi:hypothetical protein